LAQINAVRIVAKLLNSTKNCQSYAQNKTVTFFSRHDVVSIKTGFCWSGDRSCNKTKVTDRIRDSSNKG